KFPAFSKLVLGKYGAHVTTEVDCESLFSEAGALSNPRCSRRSKRMFERLVITKHHMRRLFCAKEKIQEEFIQCWKDNDWDEGETRENLDFLQEERRIHLEMFPDEAEVFDCLEKDEDTNDYEGAKHLI
ncbi:hypothetical protein ACHAXS_007078, partial [Conticribra weissflogii]